MRKRRAPCIQLCVVTCAPLAIWAIGMAGNWRPRKRHAHLALRVASSIGHSDAYESQGPAFDQLVEEANALCSMVFQPQRKRARMGEAQIELTGCCLSTLLCLQVEEGWTVRGLPPQSTCQGPAIIWKPDDGDLRALGSDSTTILNDILGGRHVLLYDTDWNSQLGNGRR